MQKQRALIALGLVSILLISAIGYSLMKLPSSTGAGLVVAEANGAMIYQQDVLKIYNQEKEYYGLTDGAAAGQAAFVQSLKEDILERLIYQELLFQNTAAAGFGVDSAALEKAQTEFAAILTGIAAQMQEEDVRAGNPTEDVDYDAKAKEYVKGELAAMGTTEDEYIKLIARQMQTDLFFDEITKDVTVTDEDIRNYYTTQLAAQRNGGTDDQYFVQLVEPASVTVKHILIALPEEEKDEYYRLTGEDEAAAQSYLEEKLQAIKPAAQAVLAEAKSGADFEKLIAEHGEDPGMTSYPEGYKVQANSQFVQEFETAALGLKPGEITDLVATYHGYHIIKAYGRTAEVIYPLAEKREEIIKAINRQKSDAIWNAKVDEWFAAATINRYTDRL